MAGSVEVVGLDRVWDDLKKFEGMANAIASLSLYVGAGVMADALNAEINNIPTEPFKYRRANVDAGERRLPSPEEKAVLQNGAAGITKFTKTGDGCQTSIGFNAAGYGEIKGKQKPVAMMAAAINYGKSWMKPYPFIKKAALRKPAAIAAIQAEAESRLNAISKE